MLPAHPGQKRFGLRWGVSSKCIFNENQAAHGFLALLSKRVLCFSVEESVFWRQFRNKKTTNVICGKRNQKGWPGFGLCPWNIITHYAVFFCSRWDGWIWEGSGPCPLSHSLQVIGRWSLLRSHCCWSTGNCCFRNTDLKCFAFRTLSFMWGLLTVFKCNKQFVLKHNYIPRIANVKQRI